MPSESGLDFRVGQLDGRVSTMESRMDRHEVEMRKNLELINTKLDSLLEYRSERVGIVRLETWLIATTLAVIGIALSEYHRIKELFER